jgi:Fur family ferric uptake transcriptional regulator
MMRSEELLKSNTLKVTKIRTAVLNLFLDKGFALTHADLEHFLGKEFDRVTLYRTLNAFEEKGITHKLLGPDGVSHFALSAGECDEHHHHDQHIHFHCTSCDKMYCLDEIGFPKINLPKGYTMKDADLQVSGLCADCT